MPAVLLAFVALVAASGTAVAEHADLGGQWHLDEPSKGEVSFEHPDSSGHGNPGDSHGGTQVSGRFGSALQFDGIGGHVRVDGADPALEPGHVTVMAWLRRQRDPPADLTYLVAKGADG